MKIVITLPDSLSGEQAKSLAEAIHDFCIAAVGVSSVDTEVVEDARV